MANRLYLDWTLNSATDRKKFIDEYLQKIRFVPTEEELETIANYILWGKDPDGQSAVQKGEFSIETRNKTWQRDDTESLDAMMESPTFNEASLRPPTEARTRIARENFDREKALAECPPHLRPVFEELFARIDKLEMQIHFYEYAHGRRKEPPRAALLKRFAQDEVDAAQLAAENWGQHKYLKQRHLIVELRREQFTLRDSYVERHLRHTPPEPEGEPSRLDFGAEVPVFPLGLVGEPFGELAFRELDVMNPFSYTEEEIAALVKFYWSKQDLVKQKDRILYFDFEDLEHVYTLMGQLEELEEEVGALPLESNLKRLLDTLEYYVDIADLSEILREVLRLKIGQQKNQDIAIQINKKYGKTYSANYISTLFRQKIIPEINRTARNHAELVENMCFEENFKKCTGCGKYLLISPEYFVRKARSKDGFSARCKACDRVVRQNKKGSGSNEN